MNLTKKNSATIVIQVEEQIKKFLITIRIFALFTNVIPAIETKYWIKKHVPSSIIA